MKTENLNEQQEIELAKIAQAIEDDIDNIDLIEREAQHISEIQKSNAEFTKRKVLAMRWLEKKEREKAARSRMRLLYVILVFICNIDHLKALCLCVMMDEQSQPNGGVGVV